MDSKRREIVGSANASSNGLPEEEDTASSLIEAGVYLEDRDALKAIEKWFDGLYRNAKEITKFDLNEARRARVNRPSNGRTSKRSFLEALCNNQAEFIQQRIYFYLYKEFCTRKENTSVERDLKRQREEESQL